MNRQSGFALSMLVLSLWMGQTALTESGLFVIVSGIPAVMLICLSGAILSGVYEPKAIPDEELSPLASRIIIAMLLAGVIISLLSFSLHV
jgi:ATP/ADP translocase